MSASSDLVKLHNWPLGTPLRGIPKRFTGRAQQHGPLLVIPQKEFARLVARASLTSKQLELPLDLREYEHDHYTGPADRSQDTSTLDRAL